MIFSDLKVLNQPSFQPTIIIPYSTSNYVQILKRSFVVTAIHKVLIITSNKKMDNSKINIPVNVINKKKEDRSKYNDQRNIDYISSLFNKPNSSLLIARNFQNNYIQSWNSSVLEISHLLYPKLSKFDEISNYGWIKILVKLLHDYGLIDKDINRDGHYLPVSNLVKRRVRIYGDCLSM